jgi:hypothetical protein
VTLAVEWNEVRDFNARLGRPDDQLLSELRARGVTAIVLSPITLGELAKQRRVQPAGSAPTSEPLDASRLRVADAALAEQIYTQWSWRSVSSLRRRREGNGAVLERPEGFSFLKDADAGFDPVLLKNVQTAGLTPILRMAHDPWLSTANLSRWLDSLPGGFVQTGVLFNSDEVPGGRLMKPFWKRWLRSQGWVQFLPEFRPAQAAWQMAHALPSHAYRAHSIPAAELKDLRPDQQLARWSRALEERSCRLLLVRMAANDSQASFYAALDGVSGLLKRGGWQAAFPKPRLTWSAPGAPQTKARLLLAFGIVCLSPFVALWWARGKPWAFAWIVAGSLAGALIAAAIADTPLTRIQVLPFRGVKAAFLFSWLLAIPALYSWDELRARLSQVVLRRDLVIGAIACAVLGYLLLRSGNAPAAWKPSWEQSVRNFLETVLIARPRFKEFAVGFPALWIGCAFAALSRRQKTSWDGRPLIALGMIGPISMINTFCHLHSPLWLELLRSVNGVVIGVLLGWLGMAVIRRLREGS